MLRELKLWISTWKLLCARACVIYICCFCLWENSRAYEFIVAGRIIGSFVGYVSRVKLTSDYGSWGNKIKDMDTKLSANKDK